jgi:hypothetical protein
MRHSLALLPLALMIWSSAASAQSLGIKLYNPVAISRRAASGDESFKAFRERLAAVAKRRIYAELTPLVSPQDFFWDRDYDYNFDPRKPAVDNLAAAIKLERDNGAGWQRLAEFAAAPETESLPSRPGVICGPALPDFDTVAFSKLLETTYTEGTDWAYPRADDTTVRATPEPKAAVIGKLGPAFVRLQGGSSGEAAADSGPDHWARVVMPDGKAGFVAPGGLRTLDAAKLCYVKDQVMGWRITGYIAGSN